MTRKVQAERSESIPMDQRGVGDVQRRFTELGEYVLPDLASSVAEMGGENLRIQVYVSSQFWRLVVEGEVPE